MLLNSSLAFFESQKLPAFMLPIFTIAFSILLLRAGFQPGKHRRVDSLILFLFLSSCSEKKAKKEKLAQPASDLGPSRIPMAGRGIFCSFWWEKVEAGTRFCSCSGPMSKKFVFCRFKFHIFFN